MKSPYHLRLRWDFAIVSPNYLIINAGVSRALPGQAGGKAKEFASGRTLKRTIHLPSGFDYTRRHDKGEMRGLPVKTGCLLRDLSAERLFRGMSLRD